jgi:hypothetical protein
VDLAELLHRRSEPELNTGCRLWSGGTVRGGYGGLFYEGRNIMAHRAAWLCEHGYLPDDACVLHRCDTPACINPPHLFLGTRLENAQDRERKGRGYDRRGERNGRSLLTMEQVVEIKNAPPSYGYKVRLSKEYGVSVGAIKQIRMGRTWRHV